MKPEELINFKKAVHKPKPKPIIVFTNQILSAIVVPKLFLWLQNNNGEEIGPPLNYTIDVLGQYCVGTPQQQLERTAVQVFCSSCVNNQKRLYKTLRTLLQRANLINTPPPRHDICYRFTKLCTMLVQQIRDFI